MSESEIKIGDVVRLKSGAVIVSRFEGRSSAWREAKAFHEVEPGKDT